MKQTGRIYFFNQNRFTYGLVSHDTLTSILFLEWLDPKAGCLATTIFSTKQCLLGWDLLDMCDVPIGVSFPGHTWQPESKQKRKVSNGWCEIYTLKLACFTHGQTAWAFPTGWVVSTLYPLLLFFFSCSVFCPLYIQSWSLVGTLQCNSSQSWLYIRMTEGAFENPSVQAMPWDNSSSSGVILSAGDIWQHLETFLVITTCWEALVGKKRPGMLLNILQCTGQALWWTIIQPQISIVLRLKTPSWAN